MMTYGLQTLPSLFLRVGVEPAATPYDKFLWAMAQPETTKQPNARTSCLLSGTVATRPTRNKHAQQDSERPPLIKLKFLGTTGSGEQ